MNLVAVTFRLISYLNFCSRKQADFYTFIIFQQLYKKKFLATKIQNKAYMHFHLSFPGIKHEWQVNGYEDIKDRSTLGEKLGGNVVVSLEGKPL